MATETVLFLALWLSLLVAGRSMLFRDPGAFWHVVVGERILTAGELPTADPFTFTFAGRRWIAQWWLAEGALALLHRVGGLDAILLATATVLAGLYTWIAHRLLRAGVHPLLAVLLTGLALAASSYHFHPRPHLFTIVLVGWTFARLCDFEAGRLSLGRLFWLLPVFALWTNVHGGVLGGVAMVAVAVAGWGLAYRVGWESPLRSARQLLLLGVLVLGCGLSILVNPYGLELPRTWLALMASPLLPRLMDEHAPLLRAGSSAWPVVAFALLYAAALVGVSPRRLRVTWLLPLIWFALSWSRIRYGPLFAVTAVIALADVLPHARWVEWLAESGSVACRLRPPTPAGRGVVWLPAFVPLVAVLLAAGLQIAGVAIPVLGRGWASPDPQVWPAELLPELRAYQDSRPKGQPIFNEMLFGGFLISSTPELRIFIDDRCELYGDEWLADLADAARHHPERIEGWAREHGFDRALVVAGSGFDRYLSAADGWCVVKRTETAVLYRRMRDGA